MTTAFEFLEPTWRRWRRWAGAGILIGALHVGGGAAALWQSPEQEVDEEPEGALMLELAPMPISPKEAVDSLPIGPPSVDSTPTPRVEEVKEMRPEELPPVEEAPLARNPEVELEKVKPVEEKVEEEEKKPQEEILAQDAPSSQAAAPPPIEAATEGPKAAAPMQGASRKPNQAQVSWQKSLHLHLSKHKRYPGEARSRRVQGVVTVAFTLDSTGKVTNVRILKGSGSSLLDEEALAMLTRASPLPAPPEDMAPSALNLSLPIQFNIK